MKWALAFVWFVALVSFSTASCAQTVVYDVKVFGGAKCDGVTDDTHAIQNTINAAAQAMAKPGSPGVIYFPPSSGFCNVTTLTYPSVHGGWLVSHFDNGIYANTIRLGGNNAYIGTTSSFGGMSGAFQYGNTSEWQQHHGFVGPLVEIQGASQVYLEGLDIQTESGNPSGVVHVHDDKGAGSVYLTFKRCTIGANSGLSMVADSSSLHTNAGFGLKIEDSSLGNGAAFTNYGQITIEHSFVKSISITNLGVAADGDLLVDDVLSEGLINQNFLTINQTPESVSDITLRRVKMADTGGTAYMVKNISTKNRRTNILIEQTPLGNYGKGLVDPTSTPYLMSLTCIGSGCIMDEFWKSLYAFQGFTYQGAVYYGSQYVPKPLLVLGPNDFKLDKKALP